MPFVNIAPVVAGTNGISPIFLTTVGVTGGIGVDLKNWVKKLDEDGKPILNNDGDPILEEKYSVATGTVMTINTKDKKALQRRRQRKAGRYGRVLHPAKSGVHEGGRVLRDRPLARSSRTFACEALDIEMKSAFAPAKEVSIEGQGLTAV